MKKNNNNYFVNASATEQTLQLPDQMKQNVQLIFNQLLQYRIDFNGLLDKKIVLPAFDGYQQYFIGFDMTVEGANYAQSLGYLVAQMLTIRQLEEQLHSDNIQLSSEERTRMQAQLDVLKQTLKKNAKHTGVNFCRVSATQALSLVRLLADLNPGIAETLWAATSLIAAGHTGYKLYGNEKKISKQKKLISLLLRGAQESVQTLLEKRKQCLQERQEENSPENKAFPSLFQKLRCDKALTVQEMETKKAQWLKEGMLVEKVLKKPIITSQDWNDAIQTISEDKLYDSYIDYKKETKSVLTKKALEALVKQKHAWEKKALLFKRGELGIKLSVLLSGSVALGVIKALAAAGIIGSTAFPFIGFIVFAILLVVLLTSTIYGIQRQPHTFLHLIRGKQLAQSLYHCATWWHQYRFIKEVQNNASLEKIEKRRKTMEKWGRRYRKKIEEKGAASWKDFLRAHPIYQKGLQIDPLQCLAEGIFEASPSGMQKETDAFAKEWMAFDNCADVEEVKKQLQRFCGLPIDELLTNLACQSEGQTGQVL